MGREAQELTLGDLIRIFMRSWLAMLILPMIGGISGLVAAQLIPRVYRAEILLAPAIDDAGTASTLSQIASQLGPVIGGLSGIGGSDSATETEIRIATLRSRRLTEDFIRSRHLLPVLFPDQWDGVVGEWKVRKGQSLEPTMDDAVLLFADEIRSVDRDRTTGLVTLSIEWSDPEAAADWANDLVARANEFLRQRAIDQALRSVAFLDEELAKTTVVDRQQVIYRLIESKTSEIMIANGRIEYAFEIVDPAVAPASDNYTWPRRGVLLFVGAFVGLLIAVTYASIRWSLRADISRDSSSP